MRIVSQITSCLLAVYVMALPVFFGLHALEHKDLYHVEHDNSLEIAQEVSDCNVCSFYYQYQGQSTVLNSFESIQITFIDQVSSIFIDDEFYNVDNYITHLRGPPSV